MSKTHLFIVSVAFAGSMLLFGCGGGKSGQTDEHPNLPLYVSNGDEGTLTGKVVFSGTAPEARTIDMSGDLYCQNSPGDKKAEQVVVGDGGLGNVFVFVKSGGPVEKNSFAVPSTAVTLDQKYCRYDPHVLGIMVGQKLEVINSDQTGHNVHPAPEKNQEWNESQPAGGGPIDKTFSKPETLIPVKCNQHPWMTAYIGVMSNPFYAVSSSKDGSYKITGLPPGDYVIAAWHEKYGEQTQKVTIGPKQVQSINFTFNPSARYSSGSLRTAEALALP